MNTKIFDIMLKDKIVRTSTDVSKAHREIVVNVQQYCSNYLLRVFAADRATQIAIRNAARLDNRNFPQQVANLLDIWLSPQFSGISSATLVTVPVTLPVDVIEVEDTTGFAPTGKFLLQTPTFFEQQISYMAKTPNSFLGCSGGGGDVPVNGSHIFTWPPPPNAAEAQANRDLFIAAFTRRSQNTISALSYINSLHIWSWNL